MMRILILGCGWYGSHLAASLINDGHDVEVHESSSGIFSGASGSNPARLHIGPHYPRSAETRAACQSLYHDFMREYGRFTRAIPTNIYAIAAQDSLLDFGTYRTVLKDGIEFITIHSPEDFGLTGIEGGIICGERHILIDDVRRHFVSLLDGRVKFNVPPGQVDDARADMVIDCSFCANDETNIDRFEPCIMALLEGPVDRSVTVMDGLFGSVYVWNPSQKLSSLTSASLTPLSKTCRTWKEAREILDSLTQQDAAERCEAMLTQMAKYWPEVRDRYRAVDYKLSIRAMPRSAADSRMVDIVRSGPKTLRIRAGKIASVFEAERSIKDTISSAQRYVRHTIAA